MLDFKVYDGKKLIASFRDGDYAGRFLHYATIGMTVKYGGHVVWKATGETIAVAQSSMDASANAIYDGILEDRRKYYRKLRKAGKIDDAEFDKRMAVLVA